MLKIFVKNYEEYEDTLWEDDDWKLSILRYLKFQYIKTPTEQISGLFFQEGEVSNYSKKSSRPMRKTIWESVKGYMLQLFKSYAPTQG